MAVLPIDGDAHLQQHVLAYGPGFFVLSTDDGATWLNMSSSNASLGALGCLRAVRCRNGTIFASVLPLIAQDTPGAAFDQLKREDRWKPGHVEADPFVAGAEPAAYRIEAGNWSDLSSYTWTILTGSESPLLPIGGGSLDLVELLEDEHTLVLAFGTGSFGVSRDGGRSFSTKSTTQPPGAAAPKWWNPNRGPIPYGNGRLVADPYQAGQWIMGTGFYPALTKVGSSRAVCVWLHAVLIARVQDEGETWTAITQGFGEVCTYPAQSHPTRVNTTWMGAMDLSAFYFTTGDVERNDFTWSFFNHQPQNNSFWVRLPLWLLQPTPVPITACLDHGLLPQRSLLRAG